jgi:hypothetical protein
MRCRDPESNELQHKYLKASCLMIGDNASATQTRRPRVIASFSQAVLLVPRLSSHLLLLLLIHVDDGGHGHALQPRSG